MQNKIFKFGIDVSGDLISSYSFENLDEVKQWEKEIFPLLKKEFGKLTYNIYDLVGFKIGDKCHVSGEGLGIFEIINIIKYSDNRYGFSLDSGWNEIVNKCYEIEKNEI